MAANRYGQIWHGNHHEINLRFPSVDSRKEFADKFSEYHGSHDHDGDPPRFELVNASDIKAGTSYVTIHDVKYVTLDGYCAHEIEDYHEKEYKREYTRYSPPTCCVPPIISINRKFVPSHTLGRHELSAIFGDMPEDDYQSLLASVQRDGFIDEVIKLYDGKVLDGWHRYCAARELNLIRKLRFQQWHEDEHRDGDPKAFVLARNIERRHLSASQRAQIVVSFNERFEKGDIESQRDGVPNGTPKTREELSKKGGVSVTSIARAIAVEEEGESEAVIAGEKTASEVLAEREAKKLLKQKKQAAKLLWDTRIQVATDYTGDSDTELNLNLTLPELEKGFAENNPFYALNFNLAMKCTSEQSFKIMWDKIAESNLTLEALQNRVRALQAYAADIRQWQRPDWSPDTNWILPLIAAKKAKASEDTTDLEPTDLKTLRDKVKAEMPKWKQRYKESGKKESELVSRASFSALIHVYRNWEEASGTATEEKAATAEELKELLKLLKSDSYVFIYRLRNYLRETEMIEATEEEAKRPATEYPLQDALDEMKAKAETPDTETTEAEIDLYYDLNHLCVLRNTLSPLLGRLGADDMHHFDKEVMTADLYDVFLQYKEVPTAKQMIIALLDVVDSILSEEIPNA